MCKAATFHVFETAQAKYRDMITLTFRKQSSLVFHKKVLIKFLNIHWKTPVPESPF